jgi:hypothetical protein
VATRRDPRLSPYRRAQQQARAAAGSLSQTAIRDIDRAMQEYAAELSARIRSLPAGTPAAVARSLEATRQIMLETSDNLRLRLEQIVGTQRRLSFETVQEIWVQASMDAAQTLGVPDALMGAVRAPPVLMIGAFENVGGARNWKTLIQGHVRNAADEASNIVRLALVEGISPDALAKRLRPYVQGSEDLHDAFGDLEGLNIAQITDPRLKHAAKRMNHNAKRIAFSEIHNARGEAEIQIYAADPMVDAVMWRLSPFRGSGNVDVCDALATTDAYGLGPGVYPVTKVPLPPHPWDRCERVPRVRPARKFGDPKPNPRRRFGGPHGFKFPRKGLTKTVADRIEEQAHRVLIESESKLPVHALERLAAGQTRAVGALAREADELEDLIARLEDIRQATVLGPTGELVEAKSARDLIRKYLLAKPHLSNNEIAELVGKQFPGVKVKPKNVAWQRKHVIGQAPLPPAPPKKEAIIGGIKGKRTPKKVLEEIFKKDPNFPAGDAWRIVKAEFPEFNRTLRFVNRIRVQVKTRFPVTRGRRPISGKRGDIPSVRSLDVRTARGTPGVTTPDEFADSLAQQLNVSTEEFNLLEMDNTEIGSYALGDYTIMRERIRMNTQVSRELRRFLAGAIDDGAVRGAKVMVHEMFHAASPASRNLSYHTIWGKTFEEGMVERNARNALTRLLAPEARSWVDVAKRYDYPFASYPDEVAGIEWLSREFGENFVEELWAADTGIRRLRLVEDALFPKIKQWLRDNVSEEAANALSPIQHEIWRLPFILSEEQGRFFGKSTGNGIAPDASFARGDKRIASALQRIMQRTIVIR